MCLIALPRFKRIKRLGDDWRARLGPNEAISWKMAKFCGRLLPQYLRGLSRQDVTNMIYVIEVKRGCHTYRIRKFSSRFSQPNWSTVCAALASSVGLCRLWLLIHMLGQGPFSQAGQLPGRGEGGRRDRFTGQSSDHMFAVDRNLQAGIIAPWSARHTRSDG